ncbi:hypothetical protein RJ639_017173 [Escallonia herrerae]|uniref:Ribosomal protein/NADH dehydrogenase domain-containing protein n=1 Tax=Escallonia herrerae TaxID=1293975 RepID=A0AA88VER6_9ASTE|nr:hypothetical protein RJ639_017173 [Escallonia herrerae]
MAWRSHISKNLKELRILFCQSSPGSSSARAFVENNYKDLKTLNPKLPILIRECRGTEPQLWARYGANSLNRPVLITSIQPAYSCTYLSAYVLVEFYGIVVY